MTKMECFIKKSRRGYDRIIDDLESLTEPIGDIFFVLFLIIGLILPIIIVALFVNSTLNPYIDVGLLFLSGVITYVWGRCIYFPLIECFIFERDDV